METGTLYIIATPIGNMEDITMRAVRILKEEIDAVYCEDTRQSRKLLEAYGVSVPARSLHAHSSDARIAEACDELQQGRTIGYLTDSGTPSLSDPGSRLVQEARRRGFLSKKPGKRIHELERLREFAGIIIVYESPYRIRKLIEAIKEVFPDSPVIIGREMTKHFEEYITGTATEIFERRESIMEKGEFSIAIHNDL
jgi:16S rRNA (cytidine1402-2'-O)-methyltransferase